MLTKLNDLDERQVKEKLLWVKRRLEADSEWSERQPLRTDHPLQLFLLQEAYEGQIFMEIAAQLVAGRPWPKARRMALHWRGCLVRLHDDLRDRFVILVWGTARDKVIDEHPELREFMHELACLNARKRRGFPRYVIVTGGSSTGAMGAMIEATDEANKACNAEVLNINVLLGFTDGDSVTEEPNSIGRNSPPLYSFVLRLYFMSLLGRPVGRVGVDGGGGTFDEVFTEEVETQMVRRTITNHSGRSDPLPPFLLVSTSLKDGGFFWDGHQRLLHSADERGTMHHSELPPHHYFVLAPKPGAMPEGWQPKHELPLLSPEDAATAVLAECDNTFRRMIGVPTNGANVQRSKATRKRGPNRRKPARTRS